MNGKDAKQCTNCPGATDHDAAYCPLLRSITFTLESLAEALNGVGCFYDMSRELIAENVFRQHPEQAEGVRGERDVFESFCTYMLDCTDEANRDFLFNFVQRWETWPDRAALAQPSPAQELDCKRCGGACSAANPPVNDCPLHQAQELEKQKPVAWGAFHFGGKLDGKLYAHCDTEAQIEAYILAIHQSSDSLTLRKWPLYAAPVAQAGQVPDVLFDGFAVYQALSDKAKGRTSSHNVSETLDAVVKLMRAAAPAQGMPSEAELEAAGLGYPLSKEEAVTRWNERHGAQTVRGGRDE